MTQPAKPRGYDTCNATNRAGTPCARPAGWGTAHLGVGRCKLHGGNAIAKHGRYSKMKRHELRGLIERHEADPDPLNILPELAAARALFEDYIERYDQWAAALVAWHESYAVGGGAPKPRQVLDIADAYRIVAEITKIVERIERIRSADAISRPDLYRVMGEMGRIVEAHVPDDAALQEIKRAWLAIRI
jgi:hypothetical protein